MTDDPYRSLAWLVRRNGGYCKTSSEFAEFKWADWLRPRFSTLEIQDLPSDPKDANATVAKAVALAHSLEAKTDDLPGYSAETCQGAAD